MYTYNHIYELYTYIHHILLPLKKLGKGKSELYGINLQSWSAKKRSVKSENICVFSCISFNVLQSSYVAI